MARLADALLATPERLVVIDGPPLLAGPEARVLAALAGQVVLVVEAGRTSLGAIDHAQRLLAGHPGVGLVLNREPRTGAPWWPWRSGRSP